VLLNEWLSGAARPDKAKLNALQQLHRKAVLGDFRCDTPHYVCNLQRVDRAHTHNREDAAIEVLKHLTIDRSLERSESDHDLDIYVRSACLPANLQTVCFGNAPVSPSANTFVVLVNSSFSERDRYLLAWDTVFGRVAKRLGYTPPSLFYAYDVGRQQQIRSIRPVNAAAAPNRHLLAWWPLDQARIVIDRISRGLYYSHSDIARALHCSAGTIYKWYEGTCALKPESRQRLNQLYLRAGARLLRSGQFHMLHANPPEAASDTISFQNLCDAMFDGYERLRSSEKPTSIDLHIRLADLVPEALAHTFANAAAGDAAVFFVLVAKNEPHIELIDNTWIETYAHVVRPTEREYPRQRII